MRRLIYVLPLLLAVLLSTVFAATQTQTSVEVAGLQPVTITAISSAVEVLATDAGSLGSKRAHVVKFTDTGGYEHVLLVRLQQAPNGIYLDLFADSTVANLDSRVGNTTITGASHPSPTEDAADTAALTDAAS